MEEDTRSAEEIQAEIDGIENDIQILKSRKQIEDAKCAVCKKDGCNVISFKHQKPVHADCLHKKRKS